MKIEKKTRSSMKNNEQCCNRSRCNFFYRLWETCPSLIASNRNNIQIDNAIEEPEEQLVDEVGSIEADFLMI